MTTLISVQLRGYSRATRWKLRTRWKLVGWGWNQELNFSFPVICCMCIAFLILIRPRKFFRSHIFTSIWIILRLSFVSTSVYQFGFRASTRLLIILWLCYEHRQFLHLVWLLLTGVSGFPTDSLLSRFLAAFARCPECKKFTSASHYGSFSCSICERPLFASFDSKRIYSYLPDRGTGTYVRLL